MFFYDSSGIVLNCTIIRNNANGAGGLFFANSDTTVINTILWENSPNQIENSNGTPFIKNCIIQNGYNGGINIIQLNPKFVNIDNGNFHLRSDSPAIDKGIVVKGVMPSCDYDGKPRIIGLRPDIGVFEYQIFYKSMPID